MSDGYVDGKNIICGVHGWDYRLDTGVSEYNNSETLPGFRSWVEDGQVFVDEDEIAAWSRAHPQPYDRDAYQGAYQDPTGTADEPYVKYIRKLAADGGKPDRGGRRRALGGAHGRALSFCMTPAPIVTHPCCAEPRRVILSGLARRCAGAFRRNRPASLSESPPESATT